MKTQIVTRNLRMKRKLQNDLKNTLTLNGQNMGLLAGLTGIGVRMQDKEAKTKKLKFLKDTISSQSLEFQNNQSERQGLLKNIYLQVNGMTTRLGEMDRSLTDKMDQYDGYIRARLSGYDFKSYMSTFKQNTMY